MEIHLMETENRQSPRFRLNKRNGSSDYLFVLFKSPALLLVGEEYVSVDSGVCVLFDKHVHQNYFPKGEIEFLHDFMHFDTETEAERALLAGIPKSVPLPVLIPERITEILSVIETERLSSSPYQSEVLSTLGNAFLYRLKAETDSSDTRFLYHKHYRLLDAIRKEIYESPQKAWSVDATARRVFISRSYLQHLYKSFFGLSFSEDVIAARIEHARVLLMSEGRSVSEIAEACGYNSVEHFIRQFRRVVGLPPHRYRASK